MRDVADVLQNLAASATHTPALYAAFLRALISAKLEPQGTAVNGEAKQEDTMATADNVQGEPITISIISSPGVPETSSTNLASPSADSANTSTSPNPVSAFSNNTTINQTVPGTNPSTAGYYQDPNLFMNEFHFESEMGPVQDISTFPPTMAPSNPAEDGTMIGGLTMENILSSGFWDSMLVPGALSFLLS